MTLPDQNISSQADLFRVRALFSKPERVIASDFFRREISRRMAERLDFLKFVPARVLDAGCGVGEDLDVLQQRYLESNVIGLDASPQLLTHATNLVDVPFFKRMASKFIPAEHKSRNWLCGDFASMPLADQSLDMLWSNLALHWHAHPEKVFAEWRRVLQADGLLMFSCFGADTFREVRRAFAVVDAYPHTLEFSDMHDIGDMLLGSGFTTPVVDMEIITLTYESVEALLQDVRAFGGNPLVERRRGLLGRLAWQQVLHELESLRQKDGRIPLTMEVIYGHAFKPAQDKTNAGESIVNFVPRK